MGPEDPGYQFEPPDASRDPEEFCQLGVLRFLPDLRELHGKRPRFWKGEPLDYDYQEDHVAGFIEGVTQIPQLVVLKSFMMTVWSDHSRYSEWSKMLTNLSNLEVLTTVSFPKPELWQALHHSGGHKGLRRLKISYCEAEPEEDRSMTAAVLRDFPALECLHLDFWNNHATDLNEHLREILSSLTRRENLKTLIYCLDGGSDRASAEFHAALQQALPSMQVREEPPGFI